LLDFASFLCLLGALFTISGGVYVRGSLDGTPLGNTMLLALGAVLANLIGTTGASMVLIRPFLRANRRRVDKTHLVVFFIFIVSNTAGLLTPLGDPPLFLGFLKGVPFEWTLRLWQEWLLVVGLLLVIFNLLDQKIFQREEAELPGSQLEEAMQHEPIGVSGWRNLWLLAGVVALVLAKGQGWFNGGVAWAFGPQEVGLLALGITSVQITPKEIHQRNGFGFGPIIEVAVLFLGIFVTMIAPLKLLNTHGGALGLHGAVRSSSGRRACSRACWTTRRRT
jgi:Na+/H+ antiporter NhaD/arsenite permease-like protein